VAVVMLQLPSEILSTVADLDLGVRRSATSLAAVEGLDTGVATLESAQLLQRLPRLAEVLREWVFRNADTAAMTLTIADGDQHTQLNLPPNVSVQTIMDAISGVIPRDSRIE
jgi:hypothetical protein